MLAPCPFCGGEAKATYLPLRYSPGPEGTFFQEYWVGCPRCEVFIKDTLWRIRVGNRLINSDLFDRLEVRRKWNYYASA